MSLLTAFNFLEIHNGKYANKAQMKLDDLKDEATYLQQQGIPVPSWREFNQVVEQKKPNYGRNIVVGIGAGAAVLGGIGMIVALAPAALVGMAFSGGTLGGLLGGYHETENSQRSAKVEAYGKMIEQIKQSAGMGLSQQQALSFGAMSPPLGLGLGNPSTTMEPAMIMSNSQAPRKEADCGCGK